MGGAVQGPAERGRPALRRRRLAAAAAAGALAAFLGAAPPALAQSKAGPAITLAAQIAVEPATQSPLPIAVGPPEAVPRNSFVRLRGLPPMASLSEGHAIAPGAWAVALSALGGLRITLPPEASGRAEIVATLVAVDGTVLAEERTTLTIGAAREADAGQAQREPQPPAASILRAGAPPAAPAGAAPEGRAPAPPAQARQKPVTPQDRERALRLIKKGDELLEQGDVAGARLLYERAADAGLAQAAMALAGTYDAAELARLKARGISPDARAARRWYERARELGAGEAEERLRRVGGS